MNKSDLKLMEDWRKKQPVADILVSKINIVYDTHKKAIKKGFKSKSNEVSTYSDGREIPIILKPNYDDDDYDLLYGLGQLEKFKKLNREAIPSVVTNENRDELIKQLRGQYKDYWDLSDIKISKAFKESKPCPFKVISKARLMISGIIDPITVDYKSGYLTDGYITYLLLKFRGVKKVEVKLD